MAADKNGRLTAELAAHFKTNREILRRQWIEKMEAKRLSKGTSRAEMDTESGVIYDTCIDCLATGNYEGAEKYARAMAEKGVLQGMTTEQIIEGMLTLRDIYGRFLCEKYKGPAKVIEALFVYEPVANKILSIVAMAFVEEKTRGLERAKAELQNKVSEQTAELREKVKNLEKFNRFAVDRELRMVELKKRIKDLETGSKGSEN